MSKRKIYVYADWKGIDSPFFIGYLYAEQIMDEVKSSVQNWKTVATKFGISRTEQEIKRSAFKIAL